MEFQDEFLNEISRRSRDDNVIYVYQNIRRACPKCMNEEEEITFAPCEPKFN